MEPMTNWEINGIHSLAARFTEREKPLLFSNKMVQIIGSTLQRYREFVHYDPRFSNLKNSGRGM
jgi:hypothetical protein